MFYHLIDLLPFCMASWIMLFGPMKLKAKNYLTYLILFSTSLYLLAQSSWFTAWIANDLWGRDFSNLIWFSFNTSVMVIYLWILLLSYDQQ